MTTPPPSPGSNGWYISRDGSSYGPYPVEQMGQMMGDGLINGDTLVWQEGMAGWVPVAMVEGIEAPPTVRIATGPRKTLPAKPRKEPSALVGFMALMALAGGCVIWTTTLPKEKAGHAARQNARPEEAEGKWYEGGTLHSASIKEWRKASPENRLATCAEFAAALWSKGRLREDMAAKIKTPDDLLGPVTALVACIDKATEPEADPKRDEEMYANQTVSEMAARCVATMGWLK